MYSFSYPDDKGFGGFGDFMAGLSLFAISIYFITSSDSGSLVVDHLASNGHENHHWIQRVFWAFTEGAVATALLVAGGEDALGALQAASIVFGLPFNLFLYGMMYCILKMCRLCEIETQAGTHSSRDDLPLPEDNSFAMPMFGGIFNIAEWIVSFGNVHSDRVDRGMDKPTKFQTREFFIGLLLPFYSLYRVCTHLEMCARNKLIYTVVYALCYIGWVSLMACVTINMGFVAFGFSCFFANSCILTAVRAQVREKFSLHGNVFSDFVAGSFLYPQAFCQMLWQFEVESMKMD